MDAVPWSVSHESRSRPPLAPPSTAIVNVSTGAGAFLPLAPLPTAAWVPERSATQARAAAARGLRLDDLLPAAVARRVERTGAYAPGDGYQVRIRELEALTVSDGNGRLGFPPEAPDRRR